MSGVNVDNERNAVTDTRYDPGEEGPPRSLRVHRERSRKGTDQFYLANFYADV